MRPSRQQLASAWSIIPWHLFWQSFQVRWAQGLVAWGCPRCFGPASPRLLVFGGMAFFKFSAKKGWPWRGRTLCLSCLPVPTVLTQTWGTFRDIFAKAELLGKTTPGRPGMEFSSSTLSPSY